MAFNLNEARSDAATFQPSRLFLFVSYLSLQELIMIYLWFSHTFHYINQKKS